MQNMSKKRHRCKVWLANLDFVLFLIYFYTMYNVKTVK